MSGPLRIAYLTGMYGRPSDTFIRQEVNQLRALGATVDTFSIRRPDAGPEPDADVVRHRDATEYLLEAGPFGLLKGAVFSLLRPAAALRALRLAWKTRAPGLGGLLRQAVCYVEAARLAERLRALRTDLLHNHIGENSATVAMLASQLTGVPFSLTIHGPGIFYAPHTWALGEKLGRAAFTACISDFCRSQCLVFAPPEAWDRLHVVRCAVGGDFLQALPDEAQPPDATTSQTEQADATFVCVGRLCAEKAQRLLVEAAARLLAEGRSLRVVLVGDGPDRAPIEATIARLGVGDRVSILGWRPSGEIAGLLRTSHALVSCSFAEGLPIVLMEAYAARRPVIATRVGANHELVENGATGWLVSPSNLDELTNALRDSLEASPDALAAYAAEGARRVTERHHPAKQAERLLALMQQTQS